MIITFVFEDFLNTVILPEKVSGKYYLKSNGKDIIGITGDNGKWILKSNKNVFILDGEDEIEEKELATGTITIVSVGDEPGWIFCDEISPDISHKYEFKKNGTIKIGRDSSNDICYKSKFASGTHATLEYNNKKWTITDNDSSNWTFVNNKRIKQKVLNYGDLIYIIGLKIIVGYDFLVVLEKGDMIDTDLKELDIPNKITNNTTFDVDDIPKDYFKKSPRFKKSIVTKTFKIDPIAANNEPDEIPAFLAIGSSLTMGLVSVASLVFSFSNGTDNPLSIIMAISMVFGTLLMPLLLRNYNKKQRIKRNKDRKEKYLEYLSSIEKKMNDEVKLQSKIREDNYPSLEELYNRVLNETRNLWERSVYQDDFLDMRIGTGSKELDSIVDIQTKTFSVYEDDLVEKMYELGETKKYLTNTPITISFYKNRFSGVIGSDRMLDNFAKNLLVEFSALYSYDELKLVFVKKEDDLDYIKWLPHTFSNDNKTRYVATNQKELRELSFSLQTIINSRIEKKEGSNENKIPYYIIFIMDQKLGQKLEILNKLLNIKDDIGFSVIYFTNQLQGLPRECTSFIELDGGTLFEKRENQDDLNTKFTIDDNSKIPVKDIVMSLANIKLMPENSSYKIPNMITFLQMFKVGKVEYLNLANRWLENDPTESLSTPIGIDDSGEEFYLDLHEKFHGPHGLVAGMTGSGKSEFIMTYILSLALNYHPSEVSFILIDYKGGGMAKTFQNLPHTAGIITNLDGALINRCLTSINSELKRRQRVLDDASQKLGISNIDIYKYQKLYREKKVDEALPHLFIISDEFAELKSQQPEFMQELISTARIGRSLGIHLILATQKPSGVVNEQIWSNSKFKICLKVATRQDSLEMLKRPEAAELKQTGRFYLQVGYDELFKLGQSAWAGAPYVPDDDYVIENKDSISIINNTGQIIKESKFQKEKKLSASNIKQIDAITKYISEYAKSEKIKPFQIWLPPIPETIYLEDIEKKYSYQEKKNIVDTLIGEFDDVENQKQDALNIPIYRGNTVIYGAPDSGKDYLLQTLVYSIITNHSSEEVNLYIVDLGSETLKMYKDIPQVGEILTIDDQDTMMDLFVMLDEELDRRRTLFADYNGSYLEYNAKSGKTEALKICVINNYDAFCESFSRLNDLLSSFYRECARYGICFIITCAGQTTLRMKVSEYFTNKLCLNMSRDEDYRNILGANRGLKPMRYLGRGIVLRDEKCYEFQTAFVDDLSNKVKKMKDNFKKNNAKTADKMPVLPDIVTLDLLKGEPKMIDHMPIGYEISNKQKYYYNFNKNLTLISSEEYDELKPFVFSLTKQFQELTNYKTMVLDFQGIYQNTKIDNYYTLDKDLDSVVHNLRKNYSKKICILIGMSNYKNSLNDSVSKELSEYLEKINGTNTIFILVDDYNGVRKLQLELWYVNNFDKSSGIWLGKNVGSQHAIKFEGMNSNIRNFETSYMAFINDKEVKIIKYVVGGEIDGYNG